MDQNPISPPEHVLSDQTFADAMRFLRLLLTRIEAADGQAIVIEPDSPLVSVARRLIDASPQEQQSTRTALMTLRDFVWRVDMFRELVTQGADASKIADLLDTADIHEFLNQEPKEREADG